MKPNDKKKIPISPEEWIAHAKSDLDFAKIGKGKENIFYEQICFHAQQAVEKALKGILLFSKIDFPLTHDLDELVDILENSNISLPNEISNIGILTPYAVETRYPGYWEEITEQDVEEAINIAENILKWASKFIDERITEAE